MTESSCGTTLWKIFIFSEYVSEETIPFTVTINVKEKANGDYVYSFNAEKESSTRRTLHADVNTRKGANGELFLDDSITQPENSVNRKFSISDNSLVEKYPNLNLNQDVSDMDGVPAIQLEDGSVLTFTEPHVTFIQNNGIDVEDIRSGGRIADGVYEPSERSDTLRYKERMQAKKRLDEKRSAAFAQICSNKEQSDAPIAKNSKINFRFRKIIFRNLLTNPPLWCIMVPMKDERLPK